jgi:hypothetical protein
MCSMLNWHLKFVTDVVKSQWQITKLQIILTRAISMNHLIQLWKIVVVTLFACVPVGR